MYYYNYGDEKRNNIKNYFNIYDYNKDKRKDNDLNIIPNKSIIHYEKSKKSCNK